MALDCVSIKDQQQTVDIGKALELLKLSDEDKTMLLVKREEQQKQPMIKVTVPPTRHDILHECDLAEDLALAFGFNAIPPALPQSNTVAEPFPLNKLSDQLRLQLVSTGWTEVLTFALCSTEDAGLKMRRPEHDMETLVRISNPKTSEFQVVRNSLLPGILKTIANNKDMALPLRLFEVQDVVHIDQSQDTNCRNERHLAAVFYSKCGSFEVIHGLLDRIMQMLDVAYEPADSDRTGGYCIRQSDDPSYFDGRCANVLYRGERIGTFGVLHPTVLGNFALTNPCSALEMNIEPFLV
uniref:phenylalanine--tRNA ligase n=1 Tax=Globodera pallida TaxID=36090 RepID=A0A183C6E0_GLOPA